MSEQSAENDVPGNCWSRLLCRVMGHDPLCYLPAPLPPAETRP